MRSVTCLPSATVAVGASNAAIEVWGMAIEVLAVPPPLRSWALAMAIEALAMAAAASNVLEQGQAPIPLLLTPQGAC